MSDEPKRGLSEADRLNILSGFFGRHHTAGNRRGQTISEHKRSRFFTQWLGTGKKILDIGCRDGVLTKYFVEGNEVAGIDIDREALLVCERDLKIKTQWGDFSVRIPFESGSFDAVVAGEILEHMPYPALFLEEVARILKPGGMFVGSVPNVYHLKNRLRILKGRLIDYDLTHLQMFNVLRLRLFLEKEFMIEELTASRGRFAFLSLAWFGRDLVWKCRKRG